MRYSALVRCLPARCGVIAVAEHVDDGPIVRGHLVALLFSLCQTIGHCNLGEEDGCAVDTFVDWHRGRQNVTAVWALAARRRHGLFVKGAEAVWVRSQKEVVRSGEGYWFGRQVDGTLVTMIDGNVWFARTCCRRLPIFHLVL